jgi:hypothetical protein
MRGKGTLPRAPVHGTRSTGVTDGLSERKEFESDATYNDASLNTSSSGAAGRSTSGGRYQRDAKGQRGVKSAKNKGLDFEIDGCGSDSSVAPV